MSTVAVILAADPGEGFAEPKYLKPLHGVRLLDLVVSDALTWPVDEVIVVLGADADEVESACDLSQVSVLVDPEWAEGGAAPFRAVLDLLSRQREVDSCVVARGDQPGISRAVVAALLARSSEGAQVVLPKYRYARGWPIVMSTALWDVFLRWEGSLDLHGAVAARGSDVEEVWFDQIAPPAYAAPRDFPRR